jgi:hypothetical protein
MGGLVAAPERLRGVGPEPHEVEPQDGSHPLLPLRPVH